MIHLRSSRDRGAKPQKLARLGLAGPLTPRAVRELKAWVMIREPRGARGSEPGGDRAGGLWETE